MRVLFVDDEPRVLEAIERTLFQSDLDWEVGTAESGPKALEELERSPYDVIVSDMRMPGMDGAALLGLVCERYPSVVRIVLSGQTDEKSALSVVRVAHQFLAKPCSAEGIRRVIGRTAELQALLQDPELRASVGQVDRLPSPPRLFLELSRLLKDEKTDIDSISAVVAQDPAMAGKLLQIASSAFFSNATSITDIRTAVIRLGLKTLRDLSLAVGAFESARDHHHVCADWVDALQRRSLKVGRLTARILPRDAEEAFMAGLMSEIGQLVLASTSPDRLKQAQDLAEERGVALHEAEAELFKVTHAEVGAFLLGLWGLPPRVVEAVGNHHRPERNAHEQFGIPQAAWLAGCLVDGTPIDPAGLEPLGVRESLERWQEWAASD